MRVCGTVDHAYAVLCQVHAALGCTTRTRAVLTAGRVLCWQRVGLFAKYRIPAGSELTFDYDMEFYGSEDITCLCGAPKCRGTLGRPKEDPAVTAAKEATRQAAKQAAHKAARREQQAARSEERAK
eukprot:3470859-Rhodomonas_salina.1